MVALLASLPSKELPATVLFVLSGLGMVWALFFAPVWCVCSREKAGANSAGTILGGCCWAVIYASTGGRSSNDFRAPPVAAGLWSSPAAILATVSGVIGMIVPLATIVQWLLARWTSGA